MHGKVKNNVPKIIVTKSAELTRVMLDTMARISAVVGVTLGPGGCPVILERQELGLPPTLTKDGVTVVKALGFADPVADALLELVRDASIRTANEAGDGTTTAIILADAIIRRINIYCSTNPQISPQFVVKSLMNTFRDIIEPCIKQLSIPVDSTTPEGRAKLKAVATISANGDAELADVVMQCLDMIGDEGNVTISEVSGPSEYRAQRIPGYPIGVGYEDSQRRFYPEFLNDMGAMRCVLTAPHFLLYHGQINTFSSLLPALVTISKEWEGKLSGKNPECPLLSSNIVVVATGFSDSVLSDLAANFAAPDTINVVPMVTPRTAMAHSQHDLLLDLAAITGATIFDPLAKPLDKCGVGDVGPGIFAVNEEGLLKNGYFEIFRYRANVVGVAQGTKYEEHLVERIGQLQTQIANHDSKLDVALLRERLAKLSSGIARLIVSGASNGELKERRDRAEDAVCAVTGAIKHGCLPGGCWTLTYLQKHLDQLFPDNPMIEKILIPALQAPFITLLTNAGFNKEDIFNTMEKLLDSCVFYPGDSGVFDVQNQEWVDAFKSGLLDSTPAVLEAVRNAMSIALILGTTGGAVVFGRDTELERQDAREALEFLRNVNVNEANNRP